ncbi:MAG: 23S rRNA (guanosine(2251)-2'-O)-methyltransferase RlmB [Anaerolineae bacterium]|nr:23S rRNA (guanosine(2251)-2'-O)-methyltransferase RlmB [Anaerolineae bacterium]MDQ7034272.1 23S rRNA (guanosine(2251)-2'-O)-methyltransferase RlmB [Anaerolineae bacterium]
MPEFIYGLWPIMETLRAGRRDIEKLVMATHLDNKGLVGEIVTAAEEKGIDVNRVQRRIIDDIANGANHQGMALRVGGYPYVDVEDILQLATEKGEKPFILILDLLKDPQNVGSLMRVADAVGIHGVVMQDRRSVSVTPAVVASSSGSVEHLRVAQVTNLVNAMKEIKDNNVWLVGMDVGPNVPPLDKTDLNMAVGMVMGSEGEGLRRLVRDTCDLLVTLPMRGQVGSLNVATAGSIALYAAWQARNWEGWAHA